jgi:hypothetical protein
MNACAASRSCSRDYTQVLIFSVGLHHQVGHVLHAATWLGVWFPISFVARSWARQAPHWNTQAGQAVWSNHFLSVHAIVWRLLLVYLLRNVFSVAAAAVSKWLSLQFHHRNHFERMQVSSSNALCMKQHGASQASSHRVGGRAVPKVSGTKDARPGLLDLHTYTHGRI